MDNIPPATAFDHPPSPPSSSTAVAVINRKQVSTIESLPNELLFDILLRLPADFLYEKARFVCRNWYEIIHSDDFTNSQIRRSTSGLLLSSETPNSRPIYVTSDGQGRIQSHELSYECKTRIDNSCNGLVVELSLDKGGVPSVHVTNPATKQPFLVPPLPPLGDGESYRYPKCNMAYSAASKEYKLTLTYSDSRSYCAGLLILTAGVDKSWRNIPIFHLSDDIRFYNLPHQAFCTEGFLHWPGGYEGRVLSLNVETETFIYSKIPKSYRYSFDRELSTGRYLSVLCEIDILVWEIWVLKPEESGVRWRNLLPLYIDLTPLESRIRRTASVHRLLPLGWVKHPEVLAFYFCGEPLCIFYNLDTREIETIELPEPNKRYSSFVHKNNLVWLR